LPGGAPLDRHVVDPDAANRGRSVWVAQCIECHGTTARGTDKGKNAFSVYYIFDPDLANPQGWGGTDRGGATLWTSVEAIDYKTGKIRWSHKWETPAGRSGLMSTAGNLVFTGDNNSNLVALNATTGEPLWHSKLTSPVSNGPISYELDGQQYVVVAAGNSLFLFAMKK